MEEEKEKRELRSPDGTEPDIAEGVARVDEQLACEAELMCTMRTLP